MVFFLGWLLSFLYNGPAIDIVFNAKLTNLSSLAISYIIAPAIILLGIGFIDIKLKYKKLFIRSGVIVCLIGTLCMIPLRETSNPIVPYTFAGILGIYSVLFITGWGCYFVNILRPENMWKHMAYVIVLGNVFFHTNSILKYLGFGQLIMYGLLLCLLGALYFSFNLSKEKDLPQETFGVLVPSSLLIMVYAFIFLLNLGGGIAQTLVEPLARNHFANVHSLDLGIYGLIGIGVFLLRRKLPVELTLSVSMMLIACGYISMMLFSNNMLPTYGLIVLGYAILDIMLWTIVAELGYVFGRPIKIFAFAMSANLFAVLIGSVIGSKIIDDTDSIYIAIAITAISIIIAFSFFTTSGQKNTL